MLTTRWDEYDATKTQSRNRPRIEDDTAALVSAYVRLSSAEHRPLPPHHLFSRATQATGSVERGFVTACRLLLVRVGSGFRHESGYRQGAHNTGTRGALCTEG